MGQGGMDVEDRMLTKPTAEDQADGGRILSHLVAGPTDQDVASSSSSSEGREEE